MVVLVVRVDVYLFWKIDLKWMWVLKVEVGREVFIVRDCVGGKKFLFK